MLQRQSKKTSTAINIEKRYEADELKNTCTDFYQFLIITVLVSK